MDKEDIGKKLVNLSVNNGNKKPEIQIVDDSNDNEGPSCGAKDELPLSKAIAAKKGSNKLICYKCKKNKSNYFNRSDYVCK